MRAGRGANAFAEKAPYARCRCQSLRGACLGIPHLGATRGGSQSSNHPGGRAGRAATAQDPIIMALNVRALISMVTITSQRDYRMR